MVIDVFTIINRSFRTIIPLHPLLLLESGLHDSIIILQGQVASRILQLISFLFIRKFQQKFMAIWIQLLQIVLPSLLTAAVIFFVIREFFKAEEKRREMDLKKHLTPQVLPMKIQAYERMTIFLERLNPNALVLRINKHNMTNKQLHHALIQAIKQEYEHNLSQQLFISNGAWELIKTAKEETIQLINIAYSKTKPDGSSNELSLTIINLAQSIHKKLPHEIALEFLKKEATQFL